jgi:outer membrane PBP1 activator LpoA protein
MAAASEAPVTPLAQTDNVSKSPHIALLLPTGSDAFAQLAEAVRAGFLEASKKEAPTTLPIRFYAVSGEPQNVIASYRQATAAGAQIVVGPLTRTGVTALAAAEHLIIVPTLALNVPDRPTSKSVKLYVLGLQLEAEARQVAQLALSEGRRKAFTVTEATSLARRTREAFVHEFERGGGHHIAEYAYSSEGESLDRLKQAAALGIADMVFFAVDAARLASVRTPMLSIAGYGTSQVNPVGSTAARSAELSNMRFVDMPWMVQPDHPAVLVYARPGPRENADQERLYALGVDAFRAAEQLLEGKQDVEIDGVTGRLKLGADHQFGRTLLVTLIESGTLVVLGETQP